jgi:hypothetical protein
MVRQQFEQAKQSISANTSLFNFTAVLSAAAGFAFCHAFKNFFNAARLR